MLASCSRCDSLSTGHDSMCGMQFGAGQHVHVIGWCAKALMRRVTLHNSKCNLAPSTRLESGSVMCESVDVFGAGAVVALRDWASALPATCCFVLSCTGSG